MHANNRSIILEKTFALLRFNTLMYAESREKSGKQKHLIHANEMMIVEEITRRIKLEKKWKNSLDATTKLSE